MSTPSSIIHICSGVRLTNDYSHTFWFSSLNEQMTYFSGKVVKTLSDYTYLRKTWNIKVHTTFESARSWSYLYFQNGTGKPYFYFINDIEYINDNTVELHLEMDVMQTYLFDYTLLPSFVEREHAASDSIGANTVEEGLELGELGVFGQVDVNFSELCLLVMSTIDPIATTEAGTHDIKGRRLDNIFYGCGIFAVEKSDWMEWGAKLEQLDEWGVSDAIMNMWVYPKSLVNLQEDYAWGDGMVTKEVESVEPIFQNVARNTVLSGGYTPRNNKLFSYPFNFLYVTNNDGNAATYRYERFGDPSYCNFKMVGALSPDAGVKMYPINYNGVPHNYEEGLFLTNFPTCAWNQDMYKLWLAQNQNTNVMAYGMAGAKIAGGVVGTIASHGLGAAAGLGTAASGVADIAALLAQNGDKEIQPQQSRGKATPSVNVANGFHHFSLMTKSVCIEQAKIIDDYFDKFGYKTNLVKIPNRNVRENWTYTKTIGCKLTGNFCVSDQVKIQSIFDNGVTFWKVPNHLGNYDLSNNTL